MSRIFLYAHGGAGNHGCEAIVRSTADILKADDLCLISSRPDEDMSYGLGELCSVIPDQCEAINRSSFDFIKAYAALKLRKDYVPMDKLWYKDAFSNIKKGDIALSIGGDNYCYADLNKYIMLHDMIKKRGAKTVLWGCSVEPDVAKRPEVARDLARYDLILARESITYEALKGINPNTRLVADPAFTLEIKETDLPDGFDAGNTVGINLSPMAMEREAVPGIAFESYKKLVTYIIENTDMKVALIPHVVWKDGDDREVLSKLYTEFEETGRVVMIEDRGCCELKYIISKCRFFIGARTHATIAAYSTGVPTLVLGYSVKSRGIARDLFGSEENYVLPVQGMKDANELARGFDWMLEREHDIRSYLSAMMGLYISRAFEAKSFFGELEAR